MSEIPSNFCPVPWMETYVDTIGDVRPCCQDVGGDVVRLYQLNDEQKHRFFNSGPFQEVRRAFLDNQKPARCRNCWTVEAQGLESQRQRALLKYRAQIPEIIARQEVEAKAPKRFDIRLSSHCNVQCKMCSPSNSNQISGLSKRMQAAGIRNSFTRREYRDDNQAAFMREYIRRNQEIENLLLAGGEPFIMPEFSEILDFLIESGRAPKIQLQILTNLTAAKDSILQKLAKFQSVEVGCSMDGMGIEFEFQRYPSSWEKVRTNFEKLVAFTTTNPHLRISMVPCITHLNLRSLPAYLRYVHSVTRSNCYSGVSPVMDPPYLHYKFVPLKYRLEVAKDLEAAVEEVKSGLAQGDYRNWQHFIKTLLEPDVEMSAQEKQELKDAVQAWEFEAPARFRLLYPWASQFLDEKKPELGMSSGSETIPI